MLLIYTDHITNRKKYIFRVFFKEILQIDYKLTSSKDEVKAYHGPKLGYSKTNPCRIPYIQANGLLDNTGIEDVKITVFPFGETKAFFKTQDKSSLFPFDIFAASFYLVSRYEEYFPYIKDEYNRFHPQESIAYKHNFLHKPLVNIWAGYIEKKIKSFFPKLIIPQKKFNYIPTYDIDLAYAYKLKGLVRSIAGYAKSISNGDFNEIIERTQVHIGKRKDPFDTYNKMHNLHKKYNLKPIYFILFSEYGQYDRNITPVNPTFQSLIKSLADYGIVGIHPSYQSNSNKQILRKEIDNLSKVLNREVIHSRQHFLKLSFPDTYRNLINYDVAHDFTMGYASQAGFRASICTPYNFYDLDVDIETKLRIHPFTYMEGTFRDYKKIECEAALEMIKSLADEVKAVNGTMYSLWHNESLSNAKRWIGWHKMYEESIKYILQVS